jgi:adenylyltransferase/sulfurtransferase
MHDRASTDLGRARALIIGAGGLGCPAALALASAGVGTLGLVDPDRVEPSNLPRQTLYDDGDVGRLKVEAARARLAARWPGLRVETWAQQFTAEREDLVAAFDVVLDGTDTIAAKFVVSDAAVASARPLVHAGVLGLQAQLLTVLPGTSACYRCVFEEAPPPGETPSCQDAGVLGPVVALAGVLQAGEAIRILTRASPHFADRLLNFDLRAGTWRSVPLARNPLCAACGVPPSARTARRSGTR